MTAILEAQGVNVRIGSVPIVSGANLTLRTGKLTALVGPNGAGKTTLVRALAGLLPVGRRASSLTAARSARFRRASAPRASRIAARQRVPLAAIGRRRRRARPHAARRSVLRITADDRAAVAQALAITETETFATRPVTTLSGGERARVALARALATQAAVLLADEPTVSLDPRHQLVVMELLRKAARNGGAVLAVVHDLALAARFADRVLVMERGRIVADAPPDEALSAERVAAVFGVEVVPVDIGGATVPVASRPI